MSNQSVWEGESSRVGKSHSNDGRRQEVLEHVSVVRCSVVETIWLWRESFGASRTLIYETLMCRSSRLSSESPVQNSLASGLDIKREAFLSQCCPGIFGMLLTNLVCTYEDTAAVGYSDVPRYHNRPKTQPRRCSIMPEYVIFSAQSWRSILAERYVPGIFEARLKMPHHKLCL